MLAAYFPHKAVAALQGHYLDQPQFGDPQTSPISQQPSASANGKPEADILVELRNVHKAFGEKKVLRGCNITIRRGEAVGIIGSSGSGKSTTLRLMAGLVAPDWVGGRFCSHELVDFVCVLVSLCVHMLT